MSRTHATHPLLRADPHRASDLFTLRRPHETPKHSGGPSTRTAYAVPADTVVLRKELPFAGYSVVKELSLLARDIANATSARVETCVVACQR